eukprot:TRINITY_DN529_c0_g1_i1.p1 TRINITY_DN529_c0_g1~~TRINITY_DN529_c0_g1_i1.p1  ORF type:complete len:198 (+),score=86.29 TRINITY_DN529_c0_g1_i1:70-663(+)
MADPVKEEVPATAPVEKQEQDSDDEAAPALEQATPQAAAGEEGEEGLKGRQTRSEKKSRKAMAKLGLKPVSGVVRVTLRKSKSVLISIAAPDVYKSPAANTYVIFGEAKIEDTNARREAEAVSQLAAATKAAAAPKEETPASADAGADADEDVDEEGLEENDIKLVMDQTSATRAKAVRALRNTNSDVVNAIMELTS